MAEQISSSMAFAAPSEANVRENAGINAVISIDAQSSHAKYRRRCREMNIWLFYTACPSPVAIPDSRGGLTASCAIRCWTALGEAMGIVFQAPGAKTVYVVGDTVWRAE